MTGTAPDFDTVIVGAGPAGCMAALGSPAGDRILMVDSRPLPRDVICGGVLSSRSLMQLAPLDPPDHIFCDPVILDWKLHDLEAERQGSLRGSSYFNVWRHRFDAWLLDLAANRGSVEVWSQTRFISAADHGDQVRVILRRGGGLIGVAARKLVGADGAASSVRRILDSARTPERWNLLQKTIANDAGVDRFTAFLGGFTDYYGWVIPKGDVLVVGAGYDSRAYHARGRFDLFCEVIEAGYGIAGRLLETMRARPAVRLRTLKEINAGTGNILLAGEAAGLICPWSGEGIAYALASGSAAGEALACQETRKSYDAAMRRLWPGLLLNITARRIMKRPRRRLAAAALLPRASYRAYPSR